MQKTELALKEISDLKTTAEKYGIYIEGPAEMESPYGKAFYRLEGFGRTLWIGKPNLQSLKRGLVILLSLGRRRVR